MIGKVFSIKEVEAIVCGVFQAMTNEGYTEEIAEFTRSIIYKPAEVSRKEMDGVFNCGICGSLSVAYVVRYTNGSTVVEVSCTGDCKQE